MLYRQKSKTAIRLYPNGNDTIGYIENIQTRKNKAFDNSGAVFLKALSRRARSLEELTKEIATAFASVDPAVIEQDAREFYDSLTAEGFLVSGETSADIDSQDLPFSYFHKSREEESDHIPGEKKPGINPLALIAERLGGKPRLWELRVELSNRCNERCVHCYIPIGERATAPCRDIDTQMFNDALYQCREAGLVRLALTGGEPMLHRDFLDFLKKAESYDFFTEIFTNLTMLDDKIITALTSPHITLVRTSLYSMDPAVHDSITGIPGSFAKTLRGIERLVEASIPVQIGCMVMKQNRDVFMAVKEWGERRNVPVITDYMIYAPFDHSGANLGSRLSLEELEQVMSRTLADDTDYLIDLKYADNPARQKLHDERICGICTFSFSLAATGDIYPCAGWQNYVLGNIRAEKIIDIVENSPKVKFLLNVRRKDIPRCLDCGHIDYCRGCLMRNAVESCTGDMFEVNEYFCAAAKIKHRLIAEKLKEGKNAEN